MPQSSAHIFERVKIGCLRFWCRIRYKIIYQPKGRALQWFLRRSVMSLIILYIATHIFLAVSFSFLYMQVEGVYDTNNNMQAIKKFTDYLHFSLVTQTTLGYRDLAPIRHNSRWLSAFQVISGIVVNALAFGLIVSRFLKHIPGLILSQKLTYDHRHTRNLNFRIRNQSADEYVNVMINANLVRRVEMDVPPYDAYHSFSLDLHIIKPDVFTPNMVLYIETISQNVDPLKPLELQENSNEFAVLRMEPDDEIEISVNAISSTRGDHINVGRSYRIKDIICGTFNSLRPYKIENDRGPIEFGNFGKIQKTDKNTCNDCELFEKCPLVLAIKCRKSKNLGAYEIKSS